MLQSQTISKALDFLSQLTRADDPEDFIHAITIGLCIVYASRYQLLKQSKQNRTFSEW
jgi:hypothetical protein